MAYNIEWLKERIENGDTLKYVFFWGHTNKYQEEAGKFCFSQWFESAFTVDSITYKTAEHWMMAHKALLFGDTRIFEQIIQCNKPGEAKELGRSVMGYNDETWNENKFEIVTKGNIHKFNQHPKLADFLLKTDNRILVEASPLDNIWGIGLSQDDKDIDNVYAWRGENLLGFALMRARDFFKTFGHFKPLENVLAAPWIKYPAINQHDTFWQMGQGKDYLVKFNSYYQNLTEREKTIYELTHPLPYDWKGFYNG